MKLKSTSRLAFPLASAIAFLLAVSYTHAATLYWDGAGAAVNWSTLNNWGTSNANTTTNPHFSLPTGAPGGKSFVRLLVTPTP